jgi:PPM family protein phosphatase
LSTVAVQFTAAAATDRGRKRPSNEDAFGYSIEHGVYLVCDGMGGAAAGEIASSIAIDEMMRLLVNGAPHTPSLDATYDALSQANHAIYERSQKNYKLCGMGTTIVALVAEERHVRVLNVGDSRCYALHRHRLQQITLDHSLVEEQVRMGRMSQNEAQRSPLRNVITRALGTQSHVTPDVFEIQAEPGDLFLLCSDGLTRELSDSQIESLLDKPLPLDELCALLVRSANKAGGNDNITCVLVRVD